MKNVYQTRFAINGDVIDEFKTIGEAIQAIGAYEEEDKSNDNYKPDEYEIYNTEAEEVEQI